jgi:hypothetical protein
MPDEEERLEKVKREKWSCGKDNLIKDVEFFKQELLVVALERRMMILTSG